MSMLVSVMTDDSKVDVEALGARVNFCVRRQDGMVDLASPSWGRILRVGLLLCAAVAINCSGGGDVEVENPCFFSTGGPDNSGSQKICAVAGEQTVED
jgi:hypothetical protein